MAVLAATSWPSNAEMILDCARLEYLRTHWRTLDPTYGKGTWWKLWRPDDLVTHNRDQDGSDFRHLDHEDQSFDAVAYDPPYVSIGGRTTSGIPEFHERFGLLDAPKSPVELQGMINAGLREMHRVVKVRGMVLVKCQNYVSSGKLWRGVQLTLTYATALGFEMVDQLIHVGHARPQPQRDRQVHARQNYSTLLVLRRMW